MNDASGNTFFLYIKRHRRMLFLALAVVVLAAVVFLIARGIAVDESESVYSSQEFDPNAPGEKPSEVAASALPALSDAEINQLKEELAAAHAALEKANTEYKAEMEARAADKNSLAALTSEKERLLAEMEVKEDELTALKQKAPPALDFTKITGLYEGCGELVTLTYNYEVMVEATTEGNIFTNKTLLYMIPGTLKIGVNFDQVKNGIAADDAAKTVTVTIPPAYFVSNEIDEGNVERYDVNRGIFSKVEDKDYLSVAVKAKGEAQERVDENGMLNYAQRLAGLEFMGLLEPVTAESGYRIEVAYGE